MCSKTQSGNLFSDILPEVGPYKAKIEKICNNDNGTFEKMMSSYVSSFKPKNPKEILDMLNKSDLSETLFPLIKGFIDDSDSESESEIESEIKKIEPKKIGGNRRKGGKRNYKIK